MSIDLLLKTYLKLPQTPILNLTEFLVFEIEFF